MQLPVPLPLDVKIGVTRPTPGDKAALLALAGGRGNEKCSALSTTNLTPHRRRVKLQP